MREVTVLNQSQGFNVSTKYTPIQTSKVLEPLLKDGFTVTKTVLTNPRNKQKEGYQKHMIRLRHPDLALTGVNDSVPEIILTNSYDRSTSLKLYIGIYRLVCANGLVVGSTFDSTAIRHCGDVMERVYKGIDYIKNNTSVLAEKIKLFNGIELSNEQSYDFANNAARLLVPSNSIIDIERLLVARRQEDATNTLWTVFNRIQETVLNGGVQYVKINDDGITQRNTTRRIKSIDRQISVNQDLWNLADSISNNVAA